MSSVWVLTSEYNQYDQYGAYFEKVWKDKPSAKELSKVIGYYEDSKTTLHVLNGGGRQNYEDQWYYLTEIKV